MFIVFLGSVILKDSPLTAVQMLWVNLIMDTFAALALATEPPTDDILLRQPYKKDAAIVTENMWRNVFGHAIYQSLVILLIIFLGPGLLCYPYDMICAVDRSEDGSCSAYNPFYTTELYYKKEGTLAFWDEKDLKKDDYDQALLKDFVCQRYLWDHEKDYKHEKFECTDAIFDANWSEYLPSKMADGAYTEKIIHYTYVFQAFVFMQVFNQINARKLEGEMNVFGGFFNNMMFIYITIFTILIQMAMVEYGGTFVKSYPFNFD